MLNSFTRAAALAVLSLPLATSASAASTWPGEAPSIGGAIAARTIAEKCDGFLSAAEMEEIAAYQAKATDEFARRPADAEIDPPALIEHVVRTLTAAYSAKYANPAACDGAAAEEARDMLARIRKVMAGGKSVLADTAVTQ